MGIKLGQILVTFLGRGLVQFWGFLGFHPQKSPKEFWGYFEDGDDINFWDFWGFIPIKPHFLGMGKEIIQVSGIFGVSYPQIYKKLGLQESKETG